MRGVRGSTVAVRTWAVTVCTRRLRGAELGLGGLSDEFDDGWAGWRGVFASTWHGHAWLINLIWGCRWQWGFRGGGFWIG